MKKAKFNLSHERKLSFRMGFLTPILCQEVLPGDSFKLESTEHLMRMAPMIAPPMHRVKASVHHFFIPNRIIWNEWEDFITGGKNGDLMPVHPFITFPSVAAPDRSYNGSLADYFGLPTIAVGSGPTVTNPTKVSALPFRAYQTIYNEFFRDQNLSDPVAFGLGSGAVSGQDLLNITQIRLRAWEKDYFTSALPWAQRISTPIGAPVNYGGGATQIKNAATGAGSPNHDLSSNASGVLVNPADPNTALRAENVANVLVEEMRLANRLQEWYEKNARGGARYIEQILAHFHTKSSDARLQRPEYLGGGSSPVVFSEVLSTFQAEAGVAPYPQGNMSGHGISAGANAGFSRKFEEHGLIISLLSVKPSTAYQQGVNKMWKRFDKFDYAFPTFAHLGEQEVSGEEIFVDYTKPANTPYPTFGYQERYAEYKYAPNTVHGNFRDNLAFWHMGRIFSNAPSLNESFVMADPNQGMERIFAVESADIDKLYCQIYHNLTAVRPLPFFGTPRI